MTINEQQDNRKFIKVRYNETIKCEKIGESSGVEPKKISRAVIFNTLDISLGGLAITGDDSFAEGSVMQFDLPIEQEKYTVNCFVRYCIPEDNIFRTSLEFIDPDKDLLRILKSLVTKLSLMGKIVR